MIVSDVRQRFCSWTRIQSISHSTIILKRKRNIENWKIKQTNFNTFFEAADCLAASSIFFNCWQNELYKKIQSNIQIYLFEYLSFSIKFLFFKKNRVKDKTWISKTKECFLLVLSLIASFQYPKIQRKDYFSSKTKPIKR